MSDKVYGSPLARRHAAAIVADVMMTGRVLKPELRQAYVIEEMADRIDNLIRDCYEPPPGNAG